jgi:hypothetical protein
MSIEIGNWNAIKLGRIERRCCASGANVGKLRTWSLLSTLTTLDRLNHVEEMLCAAREGPRRLGLLKFRDAVRLKVVALATPPPR